MRSIELLALRDASSGSAAEHGEVSLETLDRLAVELARTFHLSCHVRMEPLDVSFAFDVARRQYHSTAILAALQRMASEETRLLGITARDLYVPVLTFVFGEAQAPGQCAVISAHRLRDEFYGLPPNPKLLHERLTKAALHELGHTFGLGHCASWNCVMASTHAVERLDLKAAAYCRGCLHDLNVSLEGPENSSGGIMNRLTRARGF